MSDGTAGEIWFSLVLADAVLSFGDSGQMRDDFSGALRELS